MAKFLKKSNPNIWQLLGRFWKMSLLCKNCCGYLLGKLMKKWATFYSNIWSHCEVSKFNSFSAHCKLHERRLTEYFHQMWYLWLCLIRAQFVLNIQFGQSTWMTFNLFNWILPLYRDLYLRENVSHESVMTGVVTNLIPELMIFEKLSNLTTLPSVSREKKVGALGLTNWKCSIKNIH